MNNEQKLIKKTIKKAMQKLVAFSLTEFVEDAGGLTPTLMGRFHHVWVTTDCLKNSSNIEMIKYPASANDICRFESDVEYVMASIKKQVINEKNGVFKCNSAFPF